MRTLGGQAYVYRLTVTTMDVPAFHFPARVKPDGLTDAVDSANVVKAPAALNGRIEKAGKANEWKVELKKGGIYAFDLHARRLDSPLCGVMTVLDATGKELTHLESADAATDPSPLPFSPAVDGIFTVRIAEKFRGRGGPNFLYRLRIIDVSAQPGRPGFRLTLAGDARNGNTPDAVSLLRNGKANVTVTAERTGGFAGPIELSASLPKGVTMNLAKLAPINPASL